MPDEAELQYDLAKMMDIYQEYAEGIKQQSENPTDGKSKQSENPADGKNKHPEDDIVEENKHPDANTETEAHLSCEIICRGHRRLISRRRW